MSDPGIYDLRGLKCPLPVLKTRKRLASLPAGGELTIETSDPLAVIDIQHLMTFLAAEMRDVDNGKRLASLPAGGELTIETSDPLAVIDIPHFCSQEGHEMLASEVIEGGGHRFVIRKG